MPSSALEPARVVRATTRREGLSAMAGWRRSIEAQILGRSINAPACGVWRWCEIASLQRNPLLATSSSSSCSEVSSPPHALDRDRKQIGRLCLAWSIVSMRWRWWIETLLLIQSGAGFGSHSACCRKVYCNSRGTRLRAGCNNARSHHHPQYRQGKPQRGPGGGKRERQPPGVCGAQPNHGGSRGQRGCRLIRYAHRSINRSHPGNRPIHYHIHTFQPRAAVARPPPRLGPPSPHRGLCRTKGIAT